MNPDESLKPTENHQIPPIKAKKYFWREALEWVKVIAIALAIAIPVRYFIAEPFIVSGPSMDPTFSSGQFLIVDRVTYRFEDPKRGDIIVFEYPYNRGVFYIKRIIGLPGERVRIEDGKIAIEKASTTEKIRIDEPYVKSYHLSKDTLILPEVGKTLGKDEYIVLGDNRAESSDSRVWGTLARKFIVGRPFIRLTPLTAISIFPGQYHEATSTNK